MILIAPSKPGVTGIFLVQEIEKFVSVTVPIARPVMGRFVLENILVFLF
jgi:hypothetical protein